MIKNKRLEAIKRVIKKRAERGASSEDLKKYLNNLVGKENNKNMINSIKDLY